MIITNDYDYCWWLSTCVMAASFHEYSMLGNMDHPMFVWGPSWESQQLSSDTSCAILLYFYLRKKMWGQCSIGLHETDHYFLIGKMTCCSRVLRAANEMKDEKVVPLFPGNKTQWTETAGCLYFKLKIWIVGWLQFSHNRKHKRKVPLYYCCFELEKFEWQCFAIGQREKKRDHSLTNYCFAWKYEWLFSTMTEYVLSEQQINRFISKIWCGY